MAYRMTLQSDALKLVAQKLESSPAIEGDLREDGLAGYGDTRADLMMTLTRKLVSGEAEDEPVEDIIPEAQQITAQADALLIGADCQLTEPIPVAVLTSGAEQTAPVLVPRRRHHASAPQEQPTLLSRAEFLTDPDEQPKRAGRRSRQSGPSLFAWALEREQQAGLTAAGG